MILCSIGRIKHHPTPLCCRHLYAVKAGRRHPCQQRPSSGHGNLAHICTHSQRVRGQAQTHWVWDMLTYNRVGGRSLQLRRSQAAHTHPTQGSPLPPLLADELTCSARLTVQPSVQPLFTRKLEDVDVVEGRTARFDCMISGTPAPAVTWTHFGNSHAQKMCSEERCLLTPLGAAPKGQCPARAGLGAGADAALCLCAGQPVQEGENVRIQRDGGLHSLVIVHVGSEDEGQYMVTARNAHGQVECSAELYVEEPRPSATSQM